MKYFWLIPLLLLTLSSCESNHKSSSSIYNYIPENASIIIKTNSLESLESATSQNQLLEQSLNYSQLHHFKTNSEPIDFINPQGEFLISISKEANDSLEVTFLTKQHKALFEVDSIPNLVSETFTKDKKSITKLDLNNRIYYTSTIDSIFILSNRLHIVESAFAPKTEPLEWKNLLDVSKENKSASILIDLKKGKYNPIFFKSNTTKDVPFSNMLMLDIDINQNDVLCNGITKATDSSKSLINVFKNTIPQENKIPTVIPNDTEYFLSLTFNDVKVFNEQLSKFNSTDSIQNDEIYPFETITEAGIIEIESKKAIILKSIDTEATRSSLSQDVNSNFRSFDIYNLENTNLFTSYFLPFFSADNTPYYTIIDDFFIFSEELVTLETIISNYQNNTTLHESSKFQEIMEHLSDESSMFIYTNPATLNALLNLNFNDDKNLNLKPYPSSALQFVYDTDYAHVNGIFKTYKQKSTNNSVSEDLNISLDESILTEIQLLDNHTNNQKDIAVQDINNNLYLISNQGKIFWKKQLDSKIIGHIEQIDMYKNGRLQLAFATSKKVYVIDRNGKDVSPFPKVFNDEITQPLSVFDYDNKRDYRLLVTQGKNILMYDQKGQTVNGFKYNSANQQIITQPKHFRIGRKDFIVFADGNQMEILSRVGKRRIDVKEQIAFSGNGIFLYRNNFTTTNSSGELLEVNQKGQVSHKNLSLNENHFITTTSKTLVTLSENKLTIKSKTIDLDFGDYTAPKIFYINDKIYVSVTDRQAKKVYLFDSQAKPIKNFPVYGTSTIAMENIDRDSELEIIVKGDDKSLIVYELD